MEIDNKKLLQVLEINENCEIQYIIKTFVSIMMKKSKIKVIILDNSKSEGKK